jgi:alpha-beta hydrolase superfamily lysophospholipase
MEYKRNEWNGYELLEFELMGRAAKLVLPKKRAEGAPWLLKTEYFGAFPAFELEMLSRGWHLAYIQNKTRWHVDSDDEAKAALCELLREEFSLSEKCVTVGMSCGGLQALYFAGAHPERVAAMYLDAPVVNLLSCPCGVGVGTDSRFYPEFVEATGLTLTDMISYRNHPYDKLPTIVAAGIPIFLVCGGADRVVPYAENGKALYDYVSANGGNITEIVKPDCDHHPHGLDDLSPLIEFAERYGK